MSKQFWLGVIGGIFGILGGIFAIMLGGAGEALGMGSSNLYALGTSAVVFSIIGIGCGAMKQRKKLRGYGMILSGVAVLISISLFGVLTAIFFVIGGIVILRSGSSSPEPEAGAESV